MNYRGLLKGQKLYCSFGRGKQSVVAYPCSQLVPQLVTLSNAILATTQLKEAFVLIGDF